MAAVARGDVRPREAKKIVAACASLVDEAQAAHRAEQREKAKREGFIDITPQWGASLSQLLPRLSDKQPAVVNEFLRCGRAADQIEERRSRA